MRIGSALNGRIRSCGSGSSPSQRALLPGARISGTPSWISATSSLASVVMIANVRTQSAAAPLTSAPPGRLAHSLFREQLPGCGVVQPGQDIRDNFPSQLPAQFSERPRGTVSVNHNVVRLNRDDKIAVVTPDTNLPLCARQHGNPLLCGQAITVPGLQQRPLCE
jgi:hypothetical protein